MPYCTRCGALTDHPGGQCAGCDASSSRGIGTPEDVPCQRCGMYLPPHELRMWNSRLYCAYCIMDMQDEEEMARKRAKGRHAGEAASGWAESGEHGGGCGAAHSECGAERGECGAGGQGGALLDSLRSGKGVCEKCGQASSTLYSSGGRRLCSGCHASESGPRPTLPRFSGKSRLESGMRLAGSRLQPSLPRSRQGIYST